MAQRIYTVASHKGGVGKTTIAYELAQLLGAVLVDFEWDGGGVSNTWGYDPDARSTDRLVEAIERDRAPKPLTGRGVKPDLVPGSLYLPEVDRDARHFGRMLQQWTEDWQRDVVIDTHPGASVPAYGALSVSHVVCVPVPLKTKDLAATDRMIRDMLDYPLVLVPNMVGRFAPAAEVDKLEKMIDGTRVQIAPLISHGGRAIETRKKRMAITGEPRPAKTLQPIVQQFHALAQFVKDYRDE